MKNIKKILTLLISVVMLGSSLTAVPVFAATVCKADGQNFDKLRDAIDYANEKAPGEHTTITVTADLNVTSKIVVKNDITITDNGSNRNIYIYNTSDNDDGYDAGRGIFQAEDAAGKLQIVGTAKGRLTIHGKRNGYSTYNRNAVFYLAKQSKNGESTAVFRNVNIKNIRTSQNWGAILNTNGGVVDIENTTITSSSAYRGSAIANSGENSVINIKNGTEITGNTNNYRLKGGAVYNMTGGTINISGNVNISGNKDGSGNPFNMSVVKPTDIVVVGNASGTVGVHYPAGEKAGSKFATLADESYTIPSFNADYNSSLVSKKVGNDIVWALDSYDIKLGEASNSNGSSYSFENPSVTMPSGTVKVLSIKVNNGYFAIGDALDTYEPTGAYCILKDSYSYLYKLSSECKGEKCAEITIIFEDGISATGIKSIIKDTVFYSEAEGFEQKVTVGLCQSSDGIYVAGARYEFNKNKITFSQAMEDALSKGGNLATISDRATNVMLKDVFGQYSAWIGATLSASSWCWKGGLLDGTRISSSSTSSEGYNGAFTNWDIAAGEPRGEDAFAYMTEAGAWRTTDQYSTKYYFIQYDDPNATVYTHTYIKEQTSSILRSMNLSFDGDISMYYFFEFDEYVLSNPSFFVKVVVGNNEIIETSTIAEMSNLVDEAGYYGIKVNVPAKMMGADIKIVVCNEKGSPIKYYANYDGNHPENNYNLLYYANYMKSFAEDQMKIDRYDNVYSKEKIAFVDAMLNYGAAAQQQFGYDTDNLVNAGCEDTSATMTALPSDAVIVKPSGAIGGFNYVSLIAESNTLMKVSTSTQINNHSVYVDGKQTEEYFVEGDSFYIPVSAQNLEKTYMIYNNDGSEIIKLNANYVINLILKDTTSSAAAKKTADRLYKFGVSATEYYSQYVLKPVYIDAILNTAYAYLAKQSFSQYDQGRASSISNGSIPQTRRQLNLDIESMTPLKNGYLDCSSFVYNVYRRVFGRDMAGYSMVSSVNLSSTINTNNMANYFQEISLIDRWTDLTSADWADVLGQVMEVIQPGDLLVYYGDGGHVMLWTGSGFIHSTGGSSNEPQGSLCYVDRKDFSTDMFKSHTSTTIDILRPLEYLIQNDVQMTDYGIARTQLGSLGMYAIGYDNTLTRILEDGQYVNPGDEVEYTITITNKQLPNHVASDKKVDVTFSAPLGFDITTSEGEINKESKSVLFESVVVPAGKSVSLTVTGAIIGSAGEVLDGCEVSVKSTDAGRNAVPITFKSQSVEIENKYDDSVFESIKALATNYYDYEAMGGDFADSAAFVNYIISDVTGLDLSIGENNSEVFRKYFDLSSNYNFKNICTSAWQGDLVSNFIGGVDAFNRSESDGDFSYDARVRELKPSNLKIGDILLTHTNSNTTDVSNCVYHIYLGGDNMLRVSNSNVLTLPSAATRMFNILCCDTTIGADSFIVLRVLK